MSDGGKGSKRRPQQVTDEDLEEAWNKVFNSKPNSNQFNTNGASYVQTNKETKDES
jgi:hypothetical protein